MNEGYDFTVDESGFIYRFVSEGDKIIFKLVVFDQVGEFFTCALGDEREELNHEADFEANSNNGDIIKILSTVTTVIEHFSSLHRSSKIFIAGFDVKRQRIYQNRIKRYPDAGPKKFYFLGWIGEEAKWEVFNVNQNYQGLLAVPTE